MDRRRSDYQLLLWDSQIARGGLGSPPYVRGRVGGGGDGPPEGPIRLPASDPQAIGQPEGVVRPLATGPRAVRPPASTPIAVRPLAFGWVEV
jgi:hypothetical protein